VDQGGIDWDLLREFVARLRRDFRLERVLLFGSRARDDWLHESDYDLIVVSPDFAEVPFLERFPLVQRSWPGGPHAEIIPYAPEEFAAKSNEICIVQEAIREGEDVLGRDSVAA
jgi:hypothetical protein